MRVNVDRLIMPVGEAAKGLENGGRILPIIALDVVIVLSPVRQIVPFHQSVPVIGSLLT